MSEDHHRQLEPLTVRESIQRLRDAPVSRVAYVVDGSPRIVPVNHVWLDGSIYVHSMTGMKATTALTTPGAAVAVQVDGLDPVTRLGWSVVAHGTVYPVLDHDLGRLADLEDISWAVPAGQGTWLRIDVERVGGRRLIEA